MTLVAEVDQGVVFETEVAQIMRDYLALAETFGLTLQEAKQDSGLQSQIGRHPGCDYGERIRWCEHCGAKLLSEPDRKRG